MYKVYDHMLAPCMVFSSVQDVSLEQFIFDIFAGA